MLPKAALTRRKVELSGGEVEIRALTIGETKICQGEHGIRTSISLATGTDPRDVDDWLAETPAGDVTRLLEAIADLSGLTGAAQFPLRPIDDAGQPGTTE